jgi:hypothetical protein
MNQTREVFGPIRRAAIVAICALASQAAAAQTGPGANVFYLAKTGAGDCGPLPMVMQAGGVMPPPPGIPGGLMPPPPGIPGDRSAEASKAGAPYSAVGATETVQTLADGNRIVHTNTSHYYRDSSGRTRTELSLSAVGPFTLEESRTLVMITDPIAKQRFVLHPDQKRAEVLPLGPPTLTTAAGSTGGHGGKEGSPATASPVITPVRCLPGAGPALGTTVSLGQKTLAGLQATGTRTEHTIPAGRMGNEQPINVTSEQWVSEELGVTVSSTLHDPIIGDTQFHLSQVERGEPDPTLFVIPSDYALTDVTSNQAVIIQR